MSAGPSALCAGLLSPKACKVEQASPKGGWSLPQASMVSARYHLTHARALKDQTCLTQASAARCRPRVYFLQAPHHTAFLTSHSNAIVLRGNLHASRSGLHAQLPWSLPGQCAAAGMQ